MDDLVQHVVRELSFEGDLGEPPVLNLISHRVWLCDFPRHVWVVGVRLSLSPFLFLYPAGNTSDLLNWKSQDATLRVSRLSSIPSTKPPLARGLMDRFSRLRGRLSSRNRAFMLEFCLLEIIPRSILRLHRVLARKISVKSERPPMPTVLLHSSPLTTANHGH